MTGRALWNLSCGLAVSLALVGAATARADVYALPGENVPAGAGGPTDKDSVVKAFAACRARPATDVRCQGIRRQAVAIVREDVLTVGSSADRKYVPRLVRVLRSDAPEIRAAAADAIGMIGPTAAETAPLAATLNDPVPLVRGAAKRALEASADGGAKQLARRAVGDPGKSTDPDPAPDAKRVGPALYANAAYLYYASEPASGRLAFTTPDAPSRVLAFYTGQKRPAVTGDQIRDTYAKVPSSGEQQAMQDDAAAMQAEAEKIMAGMKPGQMPNPEQMRKLMELSQRAQQKSAPNMGRMQQEMQTKGEGAITSMQAAMTPDDVDGLLAAFADESRFGSPRYVVLEEAQTPQGPAPVRMAVVYEDRVLKQTGITLRVPPPPPSAEPAAPGSPAGPAGRRRQPSRP